MLTQEQLDQCIEYLSGSCQMAGNYVEIALDIDATEEEEDQLFKEMGRVGLIECSSCGWFGYPGDVYDEEGRCDNCAEDAQYNPDEDDF